jgi:hypothetical protein
VIKRKDPERIDIITEGGVGRVLVPQASTAKELAQFTEQLRALADLLDKRAKALPWEIHVLDAKNPEDAKKLQQLLDEGGGVRSGGF